WQFERRRSRGYFVGTVAVLRPYAVADRTVQRQGAASRHHQALFPAREHRLLAHRTEDRQHPGADQSPHLWPASTFWREGCRDCAGDLRRSVSGPVSARCGDGEVRFAALVTEATAPVKQAIV